MIYAIFSIAILSSVGDVESLPQDITRFEVFSPSRDDVIISQSKSISFSEPSYTLNHNDSESSVVNSHQKAIINSNETPLPELTFVDPSNNQIMLIKQLLSYVDPEVRSQIFNSVGANSQDRVTASANNPILNLQQVKLQAYNNARTNIQENIRHSHTDSVDNPPLNSPQVESQIFNNFSVSPQEIIRQSENANTPQGIPQIFTRDIASPQENIRSIDSANLQSKMPSPIRRIDNANNPTLNDLIVKALSQTIGRRQPVKSRPKLPAPSVLIVSNKRPTPIYKPDTLENDNPDDVNSSNAKVKDGFIVPITDDISFDDLPDVIVVDDPLVGNYFGGTKKKRKIIDPPIVGVSEESSLYDKIESIDEEDFKLFVSEEDFQDEVESRFPGKSVDAVNESDEVQLRLSMDDSIILSAMLGQGRIKDPPRMKLNIPTSISGIEMPPMDVGLRGKVALPKPIMLSGSNSDVNKEIYLSMPVQDSPVMSTLLDQGLIQLELVPEDIDDSEVGHIQESSNFAVFHDHHQPLPKPGHNLDLQGPIIVNSPPSAFSHDIEEPMEPPSYNLRPPYDPYITRDNSRPSDILFSTTMSPMDALLKETGLVQKNVAIGRLIMGMAGDVGNFFGSMVQDQVKMANDAMSDMDNLRQNANQNFMNFLSNSTWALRDLVVGEDFTFL